MSVVSAWCFCYCDFIQIEKRTDEFQEICIVNRKITNFSFNDPGAASSLSMAYYYSSLE